jgi:ribose transport system permease protein/AI-2 transport system permease protein
MAARLTSNPLKYIPKPSRREIFTIILLIAEIVIFAVIAPNFLNPVNLERVLRNATDLAIVSIGMTIVILMGGVDISVGSALGVVAIIVGWMLQAGNDPILIAVVAVAVGTLIGSVNGLLITVARIPDIIVTLGTANIWRAAVFGMLNGEWLTGLPPVFATLTRGRILDIPVSVFILLIFYVLFWLVLAFLPIGRHIYAVGNSEEAAELAGIKAKRTRAIGYAILGGLVGFASLLYVGRLGSVEITVGNDLAIASIAAVVIGGASVTGGRGSVIGTLAGVLFIAIMRNGIVLLGIPSLWERAVVGILIVVFVTVDIFINYQTQRRRQQQRVRRGISLAASTTD